MGAERERFSPGPGRRVASGGGAAPPASVKTGHTDSIREHVRRIITFSASRDTRADARVLHSRRMIIARERPDYSRSQVPSPRARARRYTSGATAMSSRASPRLMAIVRSSARSRPGFCAPTSSPRSAYGSGVRWK